MKAYCIHPSDDQVREEFMRKSVAGHDIQLEFVLEGDMKDLSDDVLNTYFEGGMCKVHPITSCTYKHFLAYRALLNSGDKVAMVLENDIEFYPNYDSVMDGVLREISERNLSNFLISLEDSQMRYIPKSKRIKGQYLYHTEAGRCAGAYLIDREAAAHALSEVEKNRTGFIIDHFHNHLSFSNQISIYWCEPPVCIQLSHNGKWQSMSSKRSSVGQFKRITFLAERAYKRILSNLK